MTSVKKQILVTGGTGYIGSHTTVELIEAGYEVIIIDNLVNSRIEVLDGIEQITGIRPGFENFDLCNSQLLRRFCGKYPDLTAIIHFAALKAVGESVDKPLEYYQNNLDQSFKDHERIQNRQPCIFFISHSLRTA